MKKRCIMIQGTMSDAGKSVVCAALCRIFKQDGYKAAPYKSQNMALNSYITRDGFEMGRAQVMQAEAAGIEPDVRMNPVLLKPSSDTGSQIIVLGEVRGEMSAMEYHNYKKELLPEVLEAFQSLAEENDIIVIEGAGSPAEINLTDNDIVNMGLASYLNAPVILVGDIDRGGVFAQLYGTAALMNKDDRDRIEGMIINKFRGDIEILEPGLKMLEEKTGIPKAVKLLEDAGWTLNREGGEFRPGEDDVRCKMIDGELVALDLTLMYPRTNHIVDTIQENFLDNLAEAGIKVTLVPEDMENLLAAYYNEAERPTDMIYLATNFHVVVDPSITYSMDKTVGHKVWNNTWSDDEELWERAVDMRKTEPGDVYSYVSKWISFQERYNEVLPAIPLYSNIYFDFYTSQLQNYVITAHVTWTQAILEAYFGEDAVEDEAEMEEGAEEDDGEAFSFDD